MLLMLISLLPFALRRSTELAGYTTTTTSLEFFYQLRQPDARQLFGVC